MPLKDNCQTPGYALEPLLQAINFKSSNQPKKPIIWDPANGEGYLTRALRRNGFFPLGSDLRTGQDFLTYVPPFSFDAIITNPPFSIKLAFVKKCIEYKIPFALLMESNTVSLGGFIELIQDLKPEIGIVWFAPRINFKMPNKKWDGAGSHFPTAWFTYNLGFSGNRFLKMNHWSKDYRAKFEI